MVKKFYWLIFILIGLFAVVLRVYRLDLAPSHLSNDEISIAFDSYSVGEIGKDEHGNSWPLAFESHATYKAPLYAYLSVPFIKVLGRTETGVRLLSSLMGVVLVLVGMELLRLFKNERTAIFVGLLLATNPWNVYSSRMAYEANLGLGMFGLGLLGLFYYIKKKKCWGLVLSSLAMGLSVWAYHTFWVLTPMVMLGTIYIYRERFSWRRVFIYLVMSFLVVLPILLNFVGSLGKTTRAGTEMWWQDNQLSTYMADSSDWWLKKDLVLATTPLLNYLQYVGFDYSFSKGLDLFESREVLDFGWFLPVTIVLFALGLFKLNSLVKGKDRSFLWFLLLVTPIVPALTKGEVALIRNISYTLPVLMFSGLGMEYLWRKKRSLFRVLSVLMVLSFGLFCLAYYVHFPISSGDRFQYGYKQAYEYLKENELDSYDWVVVEDRFGPYAQFIGVPHLYFGYFGAFDAREMQTRKSDKDKGLMIGKYRFTEIRWNSEEIKKNSIYVASQYNLPTEKVSGKLREIGVVRLPDFKEQFVIYVSQDVD